MYLSIFDPNHLARPCHQGSLTSKRWMVPGHTISSPKSWRQQTMVCHRLESDCFWILSQTKFNGKPSAKFICGHIWTMARIALKKKNQRYKFEWPRPSKTCPSLLKILDKKKKREWRQTTHVIFSDPSSFLFFTCGVFASLNMAAPSWEYLG